MWIFFSISFLHIISVTLSSGKNIFGDKPTNDNEKKVNDGVHPSHPKFFKDHRRQENYPWDPVEMTKEEVDIQKSLSFKYKLIEIVDRSLIDTQQRIDSVADLKTINKHSAPYKVGFLLLLIEQSNDALKNLFNLCVKHRNNWKELEQLRVFSMMALMHKDIVKLADKLFYIHNQYVPLLKTKPGKKKPEQTANEDKSVETTKHTKSIDKPENMPTKTPNENKSKEKPELTPDKNTPEDTPNIDKPEETPKQSPDIDKPEVTNEQTPDIFKPGETPEQTPDVDKPEVTSEQTPDIVNPEETPEQTLDVDKPEVTNEQTPDTDKPGETPDVQIPYL